MTDKRYVYFTSSVDLGPTLQGYHLKNYIYEINARTVVEEEDYIDKDYLLDYSGYYSRSFQSIGRLTKRLHFFKSEFIQEQFEKKIETGDVKDLEDSYLGFIVLKPFIDKSNNPEPSIGRTLLVPPRNQNVNVFVEANNSSNLFGINLKIDTLPFQAKDHAISICATVALWIANSKLSSLFQTPLCSPLEITNKATSLVESSRKIPNDGLTIRQILAFFRKMELEYNSITTTEIRELVQEQQERKKIISDIVRAHLISLKLPIIASLSMWSNERHAESHTVVISGYEEDDQGNIDSLYVHDDEFGPYCKIKNRSPEMDFYYWDCSWSNDHKREEKGHNPGKVFNGYKFDTVMLDVLIIPLYPKIRLPFSQIYEEVVKRRLDYRDHSCYPFISTIQDYKSSLLDKSFQDKPIFLKKQMPRFVWVIRTLKKRGSDQYITRDDLYDATSHMITNIGSIRYY
jgi:hypothetical protein